jgi:hypothetical protein
MFNSSENSTKCASPLYGLGKEEKILLGPRQLKSLFDGLSPVRNENTMQIMQHRYCSYANEGIEQGVEEEKSPSSTTRMKSVMDRKESEIIERLKLISSRYLESKDSQGVSAKILGSELAEIDATTTPFKITASTTTTATTESTASSPNILSAAFDACTPTTKDSDNLLAATPATHAMRTAERERPRLAAVTPGDMQCLFGTTEEDEEENDHEEKKKESTCDTMDYKKVADATAVAIPMPKSVLKVCTKYTEEQEQEQVTPPHHQTHKVLFDLGDTPPTPPMPERMSFGSNTSRLSLQTTPINTTNVEMDIVTPPTVCRSPRAEMIKSASKQLSNVMDILNSVGDLDATISALTSNVKTPPTSKSPEHDQEQSIPTPVYIKPASWTSLKKSSKVNSTTDNSSTEPKSVKKGMNASVDSPLSAMGPAQRTPSRRGFRQTMISDKISPKSSNEVPSPFQTKTPLKRSPIRTADNFNPTVAVEIVELSVVEDVQCMTMLADQSMARPSSSAAAIKTNNTTDSRKYEVRSIKMGTDISTSNFDVNESPIGLLTNQNQNQKHNQKENENVMYACAARISNFCDDDSDSDATVPLADIIDNVNTSNHQSPKVGSSKERDKLNVTTDSARKYKVLMSDCSDLISEIDNLLI